MKPFLLLATRAEDLPADEEYALFLRYTGLSEEHLVRRRLEAELPELRLPILAVHGEHDTIAPPTAILGWRDRLPRLRVEVIEGAAHDVLNEVAHRRVADLIAAHAIAQHAPATNDAEVPA